MFATRGFAQLPNTVDDDPLYMVATRRQGTWADSETERALKSLNGFCRNSGGTTNCHLAGNRLKNIDPNIFFKMKTDKRTRGHDFTLVKRQSRLDVRKVFFFLEDRKLVLSRKVRILLDSYMWISQ